MMRSARGRAWKAAIAVAALAVVGAACTPVAPAPPAPAPTKPAPASDTSANCPSGTGSGVTASSHVAVVEKPGEATPEVYTFEADTQAEKDAAVEELEEVGDVVSVEPDAPVSILEEDPTSPEAGPITTAPSSTSTSTTTTTTTTQPAPTTTTLGSADAPVELAVSTNDQNYSSQYGLPQSGFDSAWATGVDGDGIVIAIVDTGVQANHPDLSGHVLSGYDFVCGKGGTSVDPHGHGTHVAGIAGARDNSIFGLGGAPESRILPVRVLGSSGSGSYSDVAAGIYWAIDPTKGNADVINLSLGGGSSSTLHQAVSDAEQAGVVVVAAAGNSGSSNPSYPGGYDEVIGVGATTSNASTRASFSNHGSWVDIGAPGAAVWSTDKGSSFSSKSGTSMSTPFVAAAVALLLEHCGYSQSPTTTNTVLTRLQDAATPAVTIGSPGLGGANHLRIDNAISSPC